jgi:N-acetylgalactosamine kinase
VAHNTDFKLRDRALHVFDESRRVLAYRRICEETPGGGGDDGGVLTRLGALMDASHESCRLLYECSHPDLDALVAACRRAGAKGTRLTGAGWGGCCVSIVRREDVGAFLASVWREYFVARRGLTEEKEHEVVNSRYLFVTRPGPGASVVERSIDQFD